MSGKGSKTAARGGGGAAAGALAAGSAAGGEAAGAGAVAGRTRRGILEQGGLFALLAGCGMLGARPASAAAAPGDVPARSPGFDAKTFADAMKSLGAAPVDSKDIAITAPDIAENGAVVPVSVTSRIPNTQEICILVEKNPNPLAAIFAIPDGTEAYVSIRTKMGESTNVHAVVRADGKLYSAFRETKVTLGGCGG